MKSAKNSLALEKLDSQTDGWIAYVIRNGVSTILITHIRSLQRAMKYLELKFQHTTWPLFVDIETHEEQRFLEGSIVEYDETGEPHERFIELVRENYTCGRELSARVAL